MWCLKLCVFVLCFLYTSESYFPSLEFPSHIPRIFTPEDLGQYLQNDSRLLSEQCSTHLRLYAQRLIRLEPWAVKMFDANSKFPAGFSRVNTGILGSFDECINVESKNEAVGVIRGKYCLGQLVLYNISGKSINAIGKSDAKELYPEQRIIDLGKKLIGLPWGVCLPDACSAEDFRILHLKFLRFFEKDCQTKSTQSIEFDNADIAAIAFLGVIAALIVLSTSYDVYIYYKGPEPGSPLLRSFSVLTNGSKIIMAENKDKSIACVDGIRAITLLLLTMAYRYGVHLIAPLNNVLDLVKWALNNAAFFDAIVLADTFFVVSGMLLSYNYLKSRAKGIKFNLITFYLNRILRLTPPLAVIILIHATLLRHMGSGPAWPRTRDPFLVNNCREHWWSALLYVQNYINPGLIKICILPTWTLSAEMQMFVLSPLVLIPLTRAPNFTLVFICFGLFVAMLSVFLTAWIYQLKSVIIKFRSLTDIQDYMDYFFFATHTRAAPWIIGFILGYIIFETKKNKFRVPMRKEILGLIVMLLWAISLAAIVMCVAIGNEINGKEYNWVPHAFHMTLIRPVWAIAISWIIFACTHGYGGYVNAFLSIPVFRIISRISYSTYLVNYTLVFLLTFQTRVGLEFNDSNALNKFCGDVILCLGLGFVWNLAFESPFLAIADILFGKLERPKVKV